MDQLNKLTMGERVVVGGSVVLVLVALFLDWTTYGNFGYGAFDYPGGTWATLAVIVAVVLAGFILAVRLGNMNAPTLPTGWTWGMAYLVGCGLVGLFILLKVFRILVADGSGDFAVGSIIGVLATGAIGYGGYLLYQSDKGGGFGALRK